ncbi:hypothetical protein LTR96_003675 [Exophiala xenobiotica]|nr:hypothetical protein LTR96_003675 [Exophiala xenobiotica]KAK5343081.1 hypothetical protein LTR98_000710 [Exophiala xenobiotica]KAK5534874.1 hypothetical protein LTR23_008670 [Chaetothyriales sp. CCFEE 6169]
MSYSSTSTSTATAMQTDINRTLSFWFDGPPENWFAPANPEQYDALVRDTFGELITAARNDELDTWSSSSSSFGGDGEGGSRGNPRGSLALLLLLDQYPRNVYRGSPEAHASDAKAAALATQAIANEFDRQVGDLEALFFYLPLMHDERLVSQIACVALIETLLARCKGAEDSQARQFVQRSVGFAKSHRDVIARFGRFPSRNKILGRESTDEEVDFLKEHPSGYF